MGFKLAIAAVIVATAHFTQNDGGKTKDFKFKLHFDRLPESEWSQRIKNARGIVDDTAIKQTLKEITRGWEGQTLLLDDETGQPAEFSEEARDAMYDIHGFGDMALNLYLKEVAARVKT